MRSHNYYADDELPRTIVVTCSVPLSVWLINGWQSVRDKYRHRQTVDLWAHFSYI